MSKVFEFISIVLQYLNYLVFIFVAYQHLIFETLNSIWFVAEMKLKFYFFSFQLPFILTLHSIFRPSFLLLCYNFFSLHRYDMILVYNSSFLMSAKTFFLLHINDCSPAPHLLQSIPSVYFFFSSFCNCTRNFEANTCRCQIEHAVGGISWRAFRHLQGTERLDHSPSCNFSKSFSMFLGGCSTSVGKFVSYYTRL